MDHKIQSDSTKNILTAFFLNLLFAIIELIGGLITNSVAILSDAIHDFGDSLSLGVAYFLQKKSKKRGDDKYTYGYRRFSLLGSIFISVVLLFGSMVMIKESFYRLFNPQETDAFGMIILSVLGIIVNGAAVIRLKRGNSHNEKAVTLHMMEDVLGWATVLIGSLLMYFTGITIIDPILSILIALWVLYNVYRNLKDTLSIMLQQVPDNLNINEVENKLIHIDGVESVHDLHIWTMDGIKNIATLHLICQKNSDLCLVKEAARCELEKLEIKHSTIEVEYYEDNLGLTKSDECR
jgi:cobalt-zinc-cadmium efflux system protein